MTLASASGSTSSTWKKAPKAAAVADDWELDDDDDEDVGRSVDVQNKQIWEDA